MSDVRRREIICSLFLIGKDILKLCIQCLVFTILFSVCIENGWLGSEEMINRELFWGLYRTFLVAVPMIVFFAGLWACIRWISSRMRIFLRIRLSCAVLKL